MYVQPNFESRPAHTRSIQHTHTHTCMHTHTHTCIYHTPEMSIYMAPRHPSSLLLIHCICWAGSRNGISHGSRLGTMCEGSLRSVVLYHCLPVGQFSQVFVDNDLYKSNSVNISCRSTSTTVPAFFSLTSLQFIVVGPLCSQQDC